MVKLLFIEDNATLVNSLKDYLGKSCAIDSTSEGFQGIEKASTGAYDAIVLDLGLPDMPGRDVCSAIRKKQVDTPILILSGSSEAAMKVALLRAGADDYMTKPFHGVELKARLLALMRRGHFDPEAPYLLKAGGLVLDPSRRTAIRDGQLLDLRRKQFDILEYLMRNKGRIVTRAQIMDSVWTDENDAWNNTIDVHVKHLRDKVDKPFDKKLIITAYGVGYSIDDS